MRLESMTKSLARFKTISPTDASRPRATARRRRAVDTFTKFTKQSNMQIRINSVIVQSYQHRREDSLLRSALSSEWTAGF